MGATQSTTHSCVLKTPKGSLRGVELSDKSGKPIYQRYTRIPYAKPPVGPLRWRRPQPLTVDFSFDSSTSEAGDFAEFGPICPQPEYPSAVKADNPAAAPPIENVQDEDCLYLNIWIPSGSSPPDGWPVQFFIHGGWLQVGDAMQSQMYDPFDLLATSPHPRIIVSPTYRLNLLGFLTGPVLAECGEDPAAGNYGFWDQRAALEWTASNVSYFGGNANNISVGGLSAGANATLFQLYYDSHLPAAERLIKRVYLYSNAVGVQPPALGAQTHVEQFDELCSAVSVPLSLPAPEKLSRLRAISYERLIDTIPKLKLHTFRASTDSSFIPPTFLQSIHDGSYTNKLAENDISIMMGEVANESRLYRLVNPPSNLAGLKVQLGNYYPLLVVDALLAHYHLPGDDASADDWADTYARIVADCQVHAVIRGFTHSLQAPPSLSSTGDNGQPKVKLYRYRISWRAKSLDDWLDPSFGVCHGADVPIWSATGWRTGFTKEDKTKALEWVEPFGRFLYGEEDIGWSAEGMDERTIRCMDENGKISIEEDDQRRWEAGLAVWNAMKDA